MKPARNIRSTSTGPPGPGSAEEISSRDNRWLRRFRATLAGREDPDGLIGIEGPHLVDAALGAQVRVEAILVSTSGERRINALRPLLAPETRILCTSDRLFATVAATEAPQGIAALVHPRSWTFDDLARCVAPLIVVLAGVQDPGNVGAIIRAAEGLGASGVATCAAEGIGTANPLAPKALRASAGSALRVPLLRGVQTAALLLQLRMADIKIYAACAAEPNSRATSHKFIPKDNIDSGDDTQPNENLPPVRRPWEIQWQVPSSLWIGNEGAGLPQDILRSADARVTIPQAAARPDALESLNAASAASILLYEAARQRSNLA
jgi:RNA methyltransferase, TrmH family